MKKFTIFALALAMMFAIIACGKTEEAATVTNTPEATATPEVTDTPTATPTPEATATPEPTPTYAPEDKVVWDTSNVDVSWIPEDAKLVAFTFDDGPTTYYEQLLDVIEENDIHATFFVWGSRYNASYEDDIKRIVELGCELGNHTWDHKYLTKLTTEEMSEQVEKVRALLESITGISNFLVRPPYGSTDNTVLQTIKVPMICWSIDSQDWNNGDYDSVYNNVMSKMTDGAIVLMHANYQYTVDAVKTMIPELKAQGYTFVTVSELAAARGYTLQSGSSVWSAIK